VSDFVIIPLTERTPEWWAWRRGGIGSADAAIILGQHRSRTAENLLQEKLDPPAPPPRSFARERSAAMERQARRHYCRTTGLTVASTCVQSVARPWQRASLDGLSPDGLHAVEIKCGKSNYDAAHTRAAPPPHHLPQLQHILAVTGLPAVDFWCFCPPRPPLRIAVPRDEAYIARLLAAEEAFWLRLRPVSP
jgi:putative phage-type endonuclease